MKLALILAFLLSLIVLAGSVQAGISLGKGAVTVQSGETFEMCDVWIYATQAGGSYTVSTTGDLEPFTVSIEPNDFTLEPIDCPKESTQRRLCIAEECLAESSDACKIVCVKFTAPLVMGGEKVKYEGSILNSIRVGAATIKEPYIFDVYVEPADMTGIITGIVVVIIIVIILLLFMLRRRRR